jgi:amino acid adenylation domain-containing protein
MLSETQRGALAQRLRRDRPGSGGIPRRGPEVTELPLAYGQEQLWFVDQFAPGLSVYNIASVLRLRGGWDAGALGRALDALVGRHEALRTRLVSIGGRPVQVIDRPPAGLLAVEDLRGLGGTAVTKSLRELVEHEASRPFDLAAGPLLRVRLVRLPGPEDALIVAVHHTVFDGWSFGVFTRELAALYQAEVTGEPAGLLELPVQFADYALWERQRLQGAVLDELVGYWRQKLAAVPTVQLPTDRPRPRLQSFDGGIEQIRLDACVLDGLRALSRTKGTTLFVSLLAAVHLLLHRYTGQDDITVGTASANRGRAELAPLIGYLVNTLPIRADLSGNPTFTELLARLRTATVDAYAHQDLPFAQLVEALGVERDPSRSPLYQVGFTMAENPNAEIAVGELAMTPEAVGIMPAKVDLNFYAEIDGSGIRIDLSYATALFDRSTAARMLGHLAVLLEGVVADPGRRLSQLPVLTEAELYRELVEWNDTAAGYPSRCVHQSFEEQVRRTPDGIAAIFESEQWTYAQLNAHANQVARFLRSRGVDTGTLVGISMPPSLRRLAALLGVMKAGGGYVPLDPELPGERLAYMIGDAATSLVLADARGVPALPSTDATVLDLDEQWPAVASLPGDDLGHPMAPDDAVYVIYTSGSTGRPKGVVVEHGTVVNYLDGMIAHWPVTSADRVLQFASLSFDVSVMDMFVALCSGAAAVLGSRETLHSPPRLAELMQRNRVSFACLPPAVVNLLADQDLPDLRVLCSAGEALSAELTRAWLRPGLRFCNGYGPTEATCGVTVMELGESTPLPPPIGRPMPNYRAYVLDAYLNPLPVGVTGELHVGGPVLARGYLNQPELTRQRFIPDPFDGAPGARLYKTGDLVRRLPDGTIQFVGRIDNQIKIRGLRVELGEIESILAAHPAAAQAHVIAAADATGQKQLIGYVKTRPDTTATPAELRQYLAQQVPAYMIPAHLVILDSFPLTANGKIDVRALPRPDDAAPASHTPPRTLLETLLVDFYASLLGGTAVGIDDSFFDLGGNSLHAMQLLTELHSTLGVDTGVSVIFLNPTPRQLAQVLCDEHGFADEPLGEQGVRTGAT